MKLFYSSFCQFLVTVVLLLVNQSFALEKLTVVIGEFEDRTDIDGMYEATSEFPALLADELSRLGAVQVRPPDALEKITDYNRRIQLGMVKAEEMRLTGADAIIVGVISNEQGVYGSEVVFIDALIVMVESREMYTASVARDNDRVRGFYGRSNPVLKKIDDMVRQLAERISVTLYETEEERNLAAEINHLESVKKMNTLGKFLKFSLYYGGLGAFIYWAYDHDIQSKQDPEERKKTKQWAQAIGGITAAVGIHKVGEIAGRRIGANSQQRKLKKVFVKKFGQPYKDIPPRD